MKNLKISYSIWPSGMIVPYTTGKQKQQRKPVNTIGFGLWAAYIHSFFVQNTVKEGGVCHSDGQNSALSQAQELLTGLK